MMTTPDSSRIPAPVYQQGGKFVACDGDTLVVGAGDRIIIITICVERVVKELNPSRKEDTSNGS